MYQHIINVPKFKLKVKYWPLILIFIMIIGLWELSFFFHITLHF